MRARIVDGLTHEGRIEPELPEQLLGDFAPVRLAAKNRQPTCRPSWSRTARIQIAAW
jgi:hypothetical protein